MNTENSNHKDENVGLDSAITTGSKEYKEMLDTAENTISDIQSFFRSLNIPNPDASVIRKRANRLSETLEDLLNHVEKFL